MRKALGSVSNAVYNQKVINFKNEKNEVEHNKTGPNSF